ncbi:unnamed protein product [Toxocara canis]|uniref:Guanylate cyclase n=1 Tax=Toxocara canis TaxID=6265 RepID=A0A183V369_TOXCA|nr:unnamed protein product [Toxocara canis]
MRTFLKGLEYLHASPIGCHGSLTPWACLIDRNWAVRLTDYGVAEPLERWQKLGMISMEVLKEDSDGTEIEKSGAQQKTSILYCAPEMLRMSETNRRRGVEKSWMKQSIARRQAGDIYGFGMVMYEILFRSLPYPDNTDITELVEYLRDGSRTVRPTIQNREGMNPDLMSLLLDCWSENPDARPSIRRVRLCTETYLKVSVMSIFNTIIARVLADGRKQFWYVANELKLGRVVPPKTFSAATVMFSDIVGFTTICSSSKPLEVVTMLNAVYTGFDDIINKHEAYKVETIGDAYMVVSGIPEENGNRHLESIANIALEIMEFLQGFQIPHRQDQRIRIRLGFHTGPVAAGVVGLTSPRYCLFGDTVNTASRMESTGVPEMIQISEFTNEQLLKFYPEFRTVKRGSISVKVTLNSSHLARAAYDLRLIQMFFREAREIKQCLASSATRSSVDIVGDRPSICFRLQNFRGMALASTGTISGILPGGYNLENIPQFSGFAHLPDFIDPMNMRHHDVSKALYKYKYRDVTRNCFGSIFNSHCLPIGSVQCSGSHSSLKATQICEARTGMSLNLIQIVSRRKLLSRLQCADALSPKAQIALVKLISNNDMHINVYTFDKNPLLFEIEDDPNLYPTVYLCWISPELFPTLLVHEQVFTHLENGADLMLPGVVYRRGAFPEFDRRFPVAISIITRDGWLKGPVGVGVSLMSSMEMIANGMQGRGVQMLHVYRDLLWEFGSRVQPPQVSVPAAVATKPLSDEDFPALGELVVADEGKTETEEHLEAEASATAVDATENEQVEQRKPELEPEPETMEDLLRRCFLAALKYRVGKKTELPLDVGEFYSRFLLACVPSTKRIDMKKTKFKKFTVFLSDINSSSDGPVVKVTSKGKGADAIAEINWSHRLLVEFERKDEVTEDSQPAAKPCIRIDEYFAITEPVLPLFRIAAGLSKGDLIETPRVREIITSYVKNRVKIAFVNHIFISIFVFVYESA